MGSAQQARGEVLMRVALGSALAVAALAVCYGAATFDESYNIMFGRKGCIDNIIREVRFAEVYRHWSESQASISLNIVDGDMILIRMNENPGTGYRWELVQDWDEGIMEIQPTTNLDGLYEPTTSTDGSDDKVVTDVARPYVPPGAGEWPYPYPWGDRRFDLRAIGSGATTIKIRYKRSWEYKYSWESALYLNVTANPIVCEQDTSVFGL